jgi:hypothetical protein
MYFTQCDALGLNLNYRDCAFDKPYRGNQMSSKTPLRPDPETVQNARELIFEPPLDEGIREIVITLATNGVETFESCQGGPEHCFPEPTDLALRMRIS